MSKAIACRYRGKYCAAWVRVRLWRRQVAGLHLILEANSVVRAVAEGLVRRMAAGAKRERGPTPQPEAVTLRVHNLEIALDSKRAIAQRGDLGRWHQLLQLRKRLLLEIAKTLR